MDSSKGDQIVVEGRYTEGNKQQQYSMRRGGGAHGKGYQQASKGGGPGRQQPASTCNATSATINVWPRSSPTTDLLTVWNRDGRYGPIQHPTAQHRHLAGAAGLPRSTAAPPGFTRQDGQAGTRGALLIHACGHEGRARRGWHRSTGSSAAPCICRSPAPSGCIYPHPLHSTPPHYPTRLLTSSGRGCA